MMWSGIWMWRERRLKVQAKIIMYRMFVLIATRSACIPFYSPLPQKGSLGQSHSCLFFSPNICCRGVKQKVDFVQVEHLTVSIETVKLDSIYRSLGVTAFRNLRQYHYYLCRKKGQSLCVNQLVVRIWTPQHLRIETLSSSLLAAQLCWGSSKAWDIMSRFGSALLLLVYLAISLTSIWELEASAARLINRSHQQEVLRPISPGELVSGLVSILVCP